jgi:hypothetical protein
MAAPKRLTLLKLIQTKLEAVVKYDSQGSTPYFATVRRGRISQNARKPAALLIKDSWRTNQRGSVDAIVHDMTLLIGVFVTNETMDADAAADELEYAVATVEKLMETDKDMRKLTTSIVPLAGLDSHIEESYSTADAVLVYLITYERARGNP